MNAGSAQLQSKLIFSTLGYRELTEDRDMQRSSSKEGCPGTLVQEYLGIRQPRLDPTLYGLRGYLPSM